MRQTTIHSTVMLLAAMAAGYVGGLLSQAHHPATAATDTPAVQDVVRTHRLELLDEDGKLRGVFNSSSKNGTPTLVLNDAAEKPRGVFAVLADGSTGLAFFDAAGKPRGDFGFYDDKTIALTLYDAAGKKREMFTCDDNGSPSLVLNDSAGEPRGEFLCDDDKGPSLVFNDAEGKAIKSVP